MANVHQDADSTTTVMPPLYEYSSDDHSSIIIIVTAVSSLVMLTTLAVKIILTRSVSARFLFDKILLAAASTLFVQGVLTLVAAHLGLGKRHTAVEEIRKLQYISSLLGIAAVAGSKCALNLVIIAINDFGLMYYASRILLTLNVVLPISTLLATAFQCPLPSPWLMTATTCPAAATIYKYTASTNIVTDILLVGLSTGMVWVLEKRWTKVLITALFACRILCPVTLIPTLLNIDYIYSDDYTWLATTPTIWHQISYNLSIITACIPSMKAVLDTFSGNTLTVAVHGTFEMERGGGNGAFKVVSCARFAAARKSSRNYYDEIGVELVKVPARAADNDVELGKSESIQNLAGEKIYVNEEVEVRFYAPGASSPASSQCNLGWR